MKKTYLSLVFVYLFLAAVVGIKAQSSTPPPTAAAFTGKWMLDKEKTNITSKDFPQKLQNYKMLVGESDNMLNVKSQVDGDVAVDGNRDRSASFGSNGDSRTTRPGANGVSATNSVSESVGRANFGGTWALSVTPREATYSLNGEEVKVEMKQGDKVNGIARMKAKLDKSGKSLQFVTIRRLHTSNGEMEITTRESWKLSDDGKSIKFQRTVESPAARDELAMTLMKVE